MGSFDPYPIEFFCFFSPLLILSIVMIFKEVHRLRKAREKLYSWVRRSATVLKVGYQETNQDGVTFMPIRYEYEYNGETYSGTKATIADNLDDDLPASYFPDIYNELKEAQINNRSITVWVNPDNPKQALISNRLGKGTEIFLWGLITIGIYLIYFLFSRDSWLG